MKSDTKYVMKKEGCKMNNFIKVNEVAELLNVSHARAYVFMRECNEELKKAGKFVTAGRVLKTYVEFKTGISNVNPLDR